jgi:hypothetical protein
MRLHDARDHSLLEMTAPRAPMLSASNDAKFFSDCLEDDSNRFAGFCLQNPYQSLGDY